jgi:hypothetical protein
MRKRESVCIEDGAMARQGRGHERKEEKMRKDSRRRSRRGGAMYGMIG